jgi:hypothetical protein
VGTWLFRVVFLERVGNVLQKDQPKDNVRVLRGNHVVPQLVGRQPELGFKPDIGGTSSLRTCCA